MSHQKKAFALLSAVLLISLILLIVINVLTLAQTEKRINSSFTASQKAYYLAEAGIQKAVWLIKNNPSLSDNFESDPDWEYTFNEDNVFSSRGHLTVTIANTSQADAEVVSTASFDLGSGASSRRVVKARIYKTQSESPITNLSLLAGDDIYIWATGLDTNPGSLLANDDLDADGFSWIDVNNNTGAVNDLNIHWLSALQSGGQNQAARCSGDITPACQGTPTTISLPNVDFDSSNPNSWKNRADHVYSYQEFRDMLSANNPLEINGINYVTGKVFVKKGQNLIVNGILIADDNIDVGNDYQSSSSSAKIRVNHTDGEPSGLLSKKSIRLGKWANEFRVDGVIFAEDRFDFSHLTTNSIASSVNGIIMARDINIYNLWQNMNINYDEGIVDSTMNYSAFSPLVTIEHWEEEY